MTDKNSFWDGKRPKEEDFATKEDLAKMQKDIEKLLKDKDEPDTMGATKKLVKGMSRGIGDIARSLNSPDSDRRPKIARISARKPPIARTRVENPIAGRGAGIKKHRISNAPLD